MTYSHGSKAKKAKKMAKKMVKAMIHAATGPALARVEIYQQAVDLGGTWRWRLVARNGRILADSGEAYVKRAEAILRATQVLNLAFMRVDMKEVATPSAPAGS